MAGAALAAVLGWAEPVFAQTDEQLNEAPAPQEPDSIAKPLFSPGESFKSSDIDPVTLAILTDALKSLQFFAIAALDSDADVGLAQSGVVRAYLARLEKQEAINIAERIADRVWRARSFIWISDFVQVVEEKPDEARAWIERAIAEIDAGGPSSDGGETLEIAAKRLAERGFFAMATKAAQAIPEAARKVSTLQSVAALALKAEDNATTRKAAAEVLQAAFTEAEALPIPAYAKADILIDIGAAQLSAQAAADARKSFATAQDLIVNGPEEGRDRALTRLAAAMVESGNRRGGMLVVRMIPEGADRAQALAAVSAKMGETDIDSAVPLFRLAMEEAKQVDDQAAKFDVIAFLVAREAEVGRLKDAFEAAFLITEDVPRSEALLNMGRVLIAQGKLAEAELLKDYIPFTGMRAQVLGPVALGRGLENDREGASALLAQALDPTGYPYQSAYIADGLNAVLSAQVKAGLPSADQAIFTRAKELADTLPDDFSRVASLTQIAIAQARRGRLAEAQKTISAAYRTTFEHRESDGFDRALMQLSLAQLAAGDLLGAYDTAARVPEPPPEGPFPETPDGGFDVPRYQALIRVAAASGRLGDPRFGLEVARKIKHPPARATCLAAVAIAMANQTSDLIDVVNDIRDGALLSPNYRYLDQAVSVKSSTGPLGEAPKLTPLPE